MRNARYAASYTMVMGRRVLQTTGPQKLELGQYLLDRSLVPDAIRLVAEVLDPVSGHFRLLPAAFWHSLNPDLVKLVGVYTARWTIVTVELIEWLKQEIRGRKAVEIGAGCGDLGFHLGIPQTDSFAHMEDPVIISKALQFGQPLTKPPATVQRLDGLQAAKTLAAGGVVVGSWITQFGCKSGTATYYRGVREDDLLREASYILIGNERVHGVKGILKLPHEKYSFPWLVSRASAPELNRIWTWQQRKSKR